ncbi:MAG: hemolysin family protein [Actinomycetota bacterium]
MTSGDWFGILGVFVLIFLSAIFAAAETSITRVTRVRAYRLRDEGKRGAVSLVKIAESPPPYLNVVLLLTLAVHLAGTTIAAIIAVRRIGELGELVATVAMTFLLFVLAEVTPKTFAVLQTDRVALRLAPMTVALTRLFGPLAKGLITLANLIMPGKGLPEGPFVTEEEIKSMAEVASEEEEIEEEEKELIHSIFEFGDTVVREVMVPRPDMVTIENDASLNDVLDLVIKHGFSRIPVHKGELEEIVGIVYAKDVLRRLHGRRTTRGRRATSLSTVMRDPYFVPESKKVAELLREMQQAKVHLAVVVDEYGSVTGLVTLEDLLEEIVGEIADEYDREEPNVEPIGDDRYLVNAKLPVDELNELLDVSLPNEEWDTVGGLMMGILGRLPSQGEAVNFEQIRFTAERVQGRRIAKIKIERVSGDGQVEAVSD